MRHLLKIMSDCRSRKLSCFFGSLGELAFWQAAFLEAGFYRITLKMCGIVTNVRVIGFKSG